ncbi:M20 family metallopeptidase [Fredinandcohnia sp. 179-A 10B2 NHS]|uniref:M20 family metallopeptidase n=1 Tax=Fredinandcohnia sp. 179-A 10B2 NHS TaxID=3235176 RepID=UPI00399F0C58
METHISNTVDSLKDDIIQFLRELIQIPSENPKGDYEEICLFLQTKMMSFGFEVQLIEVPFEEVSKRNLQKPRKSVIATLKGKDRGKRLIFNAHIDTVPADDNSKWRNGPFSGHIENGKIYGRGATDCKGRLASYIMAAVTLQKADIPFDGDIIIAATCDEEIGGEFGAKYVTENKIVQGDMAVVEGYSNMIIRAMAGIMNLKISVAGKPAHSGYKWQGINAIEKMSKCIEALMELQSELENEKSSIQGMNYTTLNIGVIKGGTKINVVPGSCEIDIDFRVIPEHTLDGVFLRVEQVLRKLQEQDHELEIQIDRLRGFETNPTVVEENSPLITELQKAVREVSGKELPVVGVLGQSDARYFIEQGIPTINYGPGTNQNNLHGFNEFIEIDDLIETTKVLATFSKNILQKGEGI